MSDGENKSRFSTRMFEFGRTLGRILSGGRRDPSAKQPFSEAFPKDDERKGKVSLKPSYISIFFLTHTHTHTQNRSIEKDDTTSSW